MKYREYKILKRIYALDSKINNEQKYTQHFIVNLGKLGCTNEDILACIKSYPSYFAPLENKKDAGGYIHCVAITFEGVSAMKHYKIDLLWAWLGKIIIPAIVSIIYRNN